MRFTSQPSSVPFSILYMFQLLFIELTMLFRCMLLSWAAFASL